MSVVQGWAEGSFSVSFGISEPQFPAPLATTGMQGTDRQCCLQLRVNQDEPEDYETLQAGDGRAEDGGAKVQSSRDQMRTNVINEILSTERDYIKHLRDICEVSPAALWGMRQGPKAT